MRKLQALVAGQYLSAIRATTPDRVDFIPASPATHPQVDWPRYEPLTRLLQAQGFRHVVDAELVGHPPHPSMLVSMPVRFMVDASETVRAAFSIPTAPRTLLGLVARLMHAWRHSLTLSTVLSDDRVVVTRSEPLATEVGVAIPWRDEERVPGRLDVAALVRRHHERVARLAPPAVAEIVATPEALAAVHAREVARRLENRRSVGWATREELRRTFRCKDEEELDAVEKEFRRVVAERGL